MNFVVTGASGFIGPVLSEALASAGHHVTLVSRRKPRSVASDCSWVPRSEILHQPSQIRPEVLVHLEVKQHVTNPTAADLREFDEVNVGGTKEWLEWATRSGVKSFVFFSSIKAAGESPGCQDEQSQTSPNTPYGRSKRAAEECVLDWARRDPSRTALVLRPAVVYGPGNEANMFSFVDAIFRRRFFLVGKNDNIKSLVSLRNVVAAVLHLVGIRSPGAHLFYVTDKESFSVARLAAMINEILKRSDNVRSLPLPAAKLGALAGDAFVRITGKGFPLTSTRLKALLENTHFSSAKLQATGFVHPQTTRAGLEEMVNWYLSRVS